MGLIVQGVMVGWDQVLGDRVTRVEKPARY
jgi:hypothetical protein